MTRDRDIYLLYMGAAVALIPLLLWRDFTPTNELRYLSIADEALRNHTFFAFTNHGVPYADKPPLYFWLVMLCRWLTGHHSMLLLSLFSLLPAGAIVWVMDRWVRQEMDSDTRKVAQWMLLTCGLFLGAAVTLRMDMLMSLFILLALRSCWRIVSGERHPERERWLLPLYLFGALFTKGPIGLLVPLCSTLLFLGIRRRFADLFRCWGIRTWGVLLGCCAAWLVAVYAEGGTEYLHDLLFRQTVGRAVHSFHHAEPFYYYAVHGWYLLAPWSLLVVGVVASALRPRFVRSELQNFFLTAGLTTLLLLSCISSKLEIYLLPAIPFLLYATAMFLPRLDEKRWMRMALALPALLFALALPVWTGLKATAVLPPLPGGATYATATLLTLCGIHSLYLLYGKRRTKGIRVVIRCLGLGLLLALAMGTWGVRELNAYIGYGTLCRKALALSQAEDIREIRTWRLSRSENMDAYLHRPVTVMDKTEVPAPDSIPYLLLTRKEYLGQFSGRKAHTIGRYAVVLFQKEKN